MSDDASEPSTELMRLVQKATALGTSQLVDGPIAPFALILGSDNETSLNRIGDQAAPEAVAFLRRLIASRRDDIESYVLVFDGRNSSPDARMNGLFAEAAEKSSGDHAFLFCQLFKPKGLLRGFRLEGDLSLMQTRVPSLVGSMTERPEMPTPRKVL